MSVGKGGVQKKENRVGETQETSENSWQILLCDMLAHECRGNKHVQNLSVSDQFHLILWRLVLAPPLW